jgi:hypothetical protein
MLKGVHQWCGHGEKSPLSIGRRACRGAAWGRGIDNTQVGGFDGWAVRRGVQRGHFPRRVAMGSESQELGVGTVMNSRVKGGGVWMCCLAKSSFWAASSFFRSGSGALSLGSTHRPGPGPGVWSRARLKSCWANRLPHFWLASFSSPSPPTVNSHLYHPLPPIHRTRLFLEKYITTPSALLTPLELFSFPSSISHSAPPPKISKQISCRCFTFVAVAQFCLYT